MESSKRDDCNRNLVDEDANISKFRRRNKIIILVFLFLVVSLTLIIGALITEIMRIHKTHHYSPTQVLSPIEEFCSLSDAPTCLRALKPIVKNKFIVDTNQVFTLSLEAAVETLQHIITSLILSDSSSNDTQKLAFKNCSESLRYGLDQLRDPLTTRRVNPFVGSLSKDQKVEMMNRIMAAKEDVKSCLNDLAKFEVGEATAKLRDVEVYLNGAGDFLAGYVNVLVVYTAAISTVEQKVFIFEHMFDLCMCGLQLLFMLGMFCALFRIR